MGAHKSYAACLFPAKRPKRSGVGNSYMFCLVGKVVQARGMAGATQYIQCSWRVLQDRRLYDDANEAV